MFFHLVLSWVGGEVDPLTQTPILGANFFWFLPPSLNYKWMAAGNNLPVLHAIIIAIIMIDSIAKMNASVFFCRRVGGAFTLSLPF